MLKLNAAQLRSIIQEVAAGPSFEEAATELSRRWLTIQWVRKTLEAAKRDLGADGEGVEWDQMIEKLMELEELGQQADQARLYSDDSPTAAKAPKGSVSRVDALMNNRLGIDR